MRVPGILLLVRHHPGAHEGTAAADDAGHAVGRQRQVFLQHPGVERHVVHPLAGLVLHHIEHHARRDVVGVFDTLHELIDRHGADGHRRGVDDGLADVVDVAAGGQVHDRIGAEVHGSVQLFQLLVDLAGDGRVADVGVDLAQGGDADGHRLQLFLEVDRVGRDDHPAAGHFGADQLGIQILELGDEAHFLGDRSLAGGFELGHEQVSLRGVELWRERETINPALDLSFRVRRMKRQPADDIFLECQAGKCQRGRLAFPRRYEPDQVPGSGLSPPRGHP